MYVCEILMVEIPVCDIVTEPFILFVFTVTHYNRQVNTIITLQMEFSKLKIDNKINTKK